MMLTHIVALLGLIAQAYHGQIALDASAGTAREEQNVSTASRIPTSMSVWVTAYSSSPDETDDTPFITASGIRVHDGIIATNILPMGTRVMIPEFFGGKVFVVEDRMHSRKTNNVDIWMPSKQKARNFGIAFTSIIVVEDSPVILARN